MALRYGELGQKAKRKVWGMFLDMVLKSEQSASSTRSTSSPDSASADSSSSTAITVVESEPLETLFTDDDIDWLSKKNLNGRQIKNAVRTAQALAKSRGTRMGMREVRKVLEVQEGFENDLKGTGRLDGMHAYA